jgi:hypothetical protein
MEGEGQGEALKPPKRTVTITGVQEENEHGIVLEVGDHEAGMAVIMGLSNEDMAKYGLKGKLKTGAMISFEIVDGVTPGNIEVVNDAENLDLLESTLILSDETPEIYGPLFIALGKNPDKAVIAWVMHARGQVRKVMRQVGEQLDADTKASLMDAITKSEDVPDFSDRQIETFIGEQAQLAMKSVRDARTEKARFKRASITRMDFSGQPVFGSGLSLEDDDD